MLNRNEFFRLMTVGLSRSAMRRARRYHLKHPEVWAYFKEVAFRGVRKGLKRWSSDAICHVIRWEYYIKRFDGDDFKVTNDVTAFYARLFTATFPQYRGFMELVRLSEPLDTLYAKAGGE